MIRNLIVAMTLVTSSSIAFSATNACIADIHDPYSKGVSMPSGPHEGQCIDTAAKRAVSILGHDRTGLLISNFRHENQFWNAWIPVHSVESVEFVIVDLDAKKLSSLGIDVFHNHLRFHIKKNSPILLKSQSTSGPTKQTTVDDVIISLNYMAPKGVEYNPIKGLNSKQYLSALQVYSMHDEAYSRFVKQKKNVFAIKLNLNESQGWRTLLTGIIRSSNLQYSVPYQSWNSNCTLEVFNILDQTLFPYYSENVKPFEFSIWDIQDANFVPALEALKERNLINDFKDVYLVNKEFGFKRFPTHWNRF